MRPVCLIGAIGLLPLAAAAQDALGGKRLYLDAQRIRAAGNNCVDCHGGLPGGAYAISAAANDPARVERAVDTVPAMADFRGKLAAPDYADLAAYIGNPSVASPDLRIGTSAGTADRLELGLAHAGLMPTGQVRFTNFGQLPMQWLSAPRLAGAQAGEFAITATTCRSGEALTPGGSCTVDVGVSAPAAASALRQAVLQIDHDWIGGQVAVGLFAQAGTAQTGAAPSSGAGGGGAPPWIWIALLLMAAVAGRRPGAVAFAAAKSTNEHGVEACPPWQCQTDAVQGKAFKRPVWPARRMR